MATKKTGTSAKKKTGAKPKVTKTTKVTTVKAVESGSSRLAGSIKGGFLRMPVAGAALAEFIGAFLLATTVLIIHNEPFYMFIALIGIFMMVGGISGAHVNPAITVGAWVTRRINSVRALSYLAAQFLGAMLALVVMDAFLGQAPEVSAEAASFGQTAPELFRVSMDTLSEGKEQVVLFAEIIGVAILGFAYASVLRPRVNNKVMGAFTVGGAGFIAMAFASTVANYVGAKAVLSPATALTLKAVDFANMNSWSLAIYLIAPLIGAVIGFFLHDLLESTEAEQKIA